VSVALPEGVFHLLTVDDELPRPYGDLVTVCGEVVHTSALPPACYPPEGESDRDPWYCSACVRAAVRWSAEARSPNGTFCASRAPLSGQMEPFGTRVPAADRQTEGGVLWITRACLWMAVWSLANVQAQCRAWGERSISLDWGRCSGEATQCALAHCVRANSAAQRCGGYSRVCIRKRAWRRPTSCTALQRRWRYRRRRSSRVDPPPRYAAWPSLVRRIQWKHWCPWRPGLFAVAGWLSVGPRFTATTGFRGLGRVLWITGRGRGARF
jgi:hypothetical protein